MPASLPTFSKGLKIIRIGALVMLLGLVVSVVTTVRLLTADVGDESRSAIDWLQYGLIANAVATFAMFVGMVRAIPELARFRMNIGNLVMSACGFFIAAAMLAWSYHLISSFMNVALNPDRMLEDLAAAAENLNSLKAITIVKDLAYAFGLICMLRQVSRSAAFNDQITLRDEAASMGRALILMLVGDLFYQLTYGLGDGAGISLAIFGLIASLLVTGFWIYCHLRLVRHLYNAEYFMNEPHELPLATVLRVPDAKPAPRPAPRPSKPALEETAPLAVPPVVVRPVVVPPTAPTPASPRAESAGDGDASGDGPRFLR